jgi:hypothetical protein
VGNCSKRTQGIDKGCAALASDRAAERSGSDDPEAMSTITADLEICAHCGRAASREAACHLYRDNGPVTLCSAHCAELFLVASLSSADTADKESVVDAMMAGWRRSFSTR